MAHAAEWLAWECGYKTSPHTLPNPLDAEVEAWLGFDEAAWETLKEELAEQFKAAEGLLQAAHS